MKRLFNSAFWLFALLCFRPTDVSAQLDVDSADASGEYYDANYLRYINFTYKPEVKSVVLHKSQWPLSPPIIELNSGEQLELHFDILDSALANLMYTVIHCDYDWKPSQLDKQEYMTGQFEDFINQYDYSRNTYQKYIHYSLSIPNDVIQLTRSGNYLLKVYVSGDEDDLILTRRFCVTENILNVKATVHQPTQVSKRYTHQEVDFSFTSDDYEITNPYHDLKVVILQNHSWENAITGLKPRFVMNSEFNYDYDGENTFEGLNEFRIIDLKNTRFTGQGVQKMVVENRENHAYLVLDKSRASMVYLQRPDINGWFLIKNDWLNTQADIDADYVHTHFRLGMNQPIKNADVYVFGALTDWQLKPEAKMTYSNADLAYSCDLYLKQGLYNYLYAVAFDGTDEPDLSVIEGSHFQTENEYSILIYHRQLGWDYDRLLSYTTVRYGAD
ncbi:MAG: DUF5103 domain-containing protein [Salibacteraceae bacterium]